MCPQTLLISLFYCFFQVLRESAREVKGVSGTVEQLSGCSATLECVCRGFTGGR